MLFWERNLDSNQCRYSSDATRAGVSRGIRDLIQMGDDQGLNSQPPGMSQALHPQKVSVKGCWEFSSSLSRELRRNRGALTDHAQPLALPGLAWATGMCSVPPSLALVPAPSDSSAPHQHRGRRRSKIKSIRSDSSSAKCIVIWQWRPPPRPWAWCKPRALRRGR